MASSNNDFSDPLLLGDVDVFVPAAPMKPVDSGNMKDDSTLVTAETQTVTTAADDTESLVSALSDIGFAVSSIAVRPWDTKKHYSDMIRDGMKYINRGKADYDPNVIMLFESPSSCSHDTSFFNGQTFRFHDYPPSKPLAKSLLAPCRYTMMNGASYPSFLKCGKAPEGLVEHWQKALPNFVKPNFVPEIKNSDTVYAYLPVEHIANHVNNPHVHYHLCGKDVLHLMTQHTPKLLGNTQVQRPCICKTTHSMGSKGIFVIRNDEDEANFQAFLEESGNPTYVVTEFVDIARNVACHFFIHPNGEEISWIGSNENRPRGDGIFSTDSTIDMKEQEYLRDIQVPFVKDVAKYMHSLGFWGFCGVDVLFDKSGKGYLVDVNPRVTGSSPAILAQLRLNERYGFQQCLFRRSGKYAYRGTAKELLQEVDEYNQDNEGKSRVVISCFHEESTTCTLLQLGVFGCDSLDECEQVLNHFAPLKQQPM